MLQNSVNIYIDPQCQKLIGVLSTLSNQSTWHHVICKIWKRPKLVAATLIWLQYSTKHYSKPVGSDKWVFGYIKQNVHCPTRARLSGFLSLIFLHTHPYCFLQMSGWLLHGFHNFYRSGRGITTDRDRHFLVVETHLEVAGKHLEI